MLEMDNERKVVYSYLSIFYQTIITFVSLEEMLPYCSLSMLYELDFCFRASKSF